MYEITDVVTTFIFLMQTMSSTLFVLGYQHYDFCVVKELSDLKPDSSIIAKEQNSGER